MRRLAREHRADDKPFDPSKRGTWRGSSKDLVVNGRVEDECLVITLDGERYGTAIANPEDVSENSSLFVFSFTVGTSAAGTTKVGVWERSRHTDDALELAAEWLEQYAPGIFWNSDGRPREYGYTLETEYGLLNPSEMDIQELRSGPLYVAALDESEKRNQQAEGVAIEDLSFDLADYGERLQHWHSGQGDPIYAVGSLAFSGRIHPDSDVILAAEGELERLERSGSFEGEELDELQDLIDQTREISGGSGLEPNSGGKSLWSVRYVHKISPKSTDVGPDITLSDSDFSDSKRLARALRDARVLATGGRVKSFRIEGDKVVVFPSVPGLTTYWHAIILTHAD